MSLPPRGFRCRLQPTPNFETHRCLLPNPFSLEWGAGQFHVSLLTAKRRSVEDAGRSTLKRNPGKKNPPLMRTKPQLDPDVFKKKNRCRNHFKKLNGTMSFYHGGTNMKFLVLLLQLFCKHLKDLFKSVSFIHFQQIDK